ncbi:MAG: dihydropteroate synthase, partial [SAR324 cluster bacterium]|nr:dihydropteroate synthase [SAR324 cluster bacterium]
MFSIDTRKSSIMYKSLKYGINIVNDVSGLEHDNKTISFL